MVRIRDWKERCFEDSGICDGNNAVIQALQCSLASQWNRTANAPIWSDSAYVAKGTKAEQHWLPRRGATGKHLPHASYFLSAAGCVHL